MYIETSQMRGSYRPVDISFPRADMAGTESCHEPVRIKAILRREADRYRFEGHLATQVGLSCALCNRVSDQVVEIDFSLVYCQPNTDCSPSGTLPEDHELTAEECDMEVLDPKGRLDLLSFSRDQIYLALPFQPRCREDCAGLCSQCGADLNDSTCACSFPSLDPRLAALAEIRNNF